MSNNSADIVKRLNANRPAIIDTLGGRVTDADSGSCRMSWEIGEQFCHSINVVQGGIITAMLDATMSHAAFAHQSDIIGVATLEIKVSFLEPSHAGHFEGVGRVRRGGRSIAFLEGELYNAEGQLTATATTTAKLSRQGS